MLGLESSGFIICLGVSLLLSGMIMYYCRQKLTQYEHKLDSMFQLITALTEEVNKPLSNAMPNAMPGAMPGAMPNAMSNTMPESELNDTSEKASASSDLSMDNRVPIGELQSYEPTMNSDHHPYDDQKTIHLNSQHVEEDSESDSDDDSDESESESESENETETDNGLQNSIGNSIANSIGNSIGNMVDVKIVDMNLDVAPLEDLTTLLGTTIDVQVADLSNKIEEIIDTKVDADSDTNVDANKDNKKYSKMTVSELRKMVSEKQLSPHPSKLKKGELLELLS